MDNLFPSAAIHDEIVEGPVSLSSSESKSSLEMGNVPVTRGMLLEGQRLDPSLANYWRERSRRLRMKTSRSVILLNQVAKLQNFVRIATFVSLLINQIR